MAGDKRGVALLASILLLGVLVLTPAAIGWFYDFLSSLTHQVVVARVDDVSLVDLRLGWYNSTAGAWTWEGQEWTYDPERYTVIVPSVSQGGDSGSTVLLSIQLNASCFTGKWLWDEHIERLRVAVSASANVSISEVRIYAYDDAGEAYDKSFGVSANGTELAVGVELGYATRAWFSQFTGQQNGIGLQVRLVFSAPQNLAGEYLELAVSFLRSEKSWVAGLADYMLGMAGIGLLVLGLFATPFVSIRQIREFFRPRRR